MSSRVDRLRSLLAERGLDAAIISHPSNRFYLSGFTGEDFPPDESAGMLVMSSDTATLITGATNMAWASAEAPGFTIRQRDGGWSSTIAEHIREHRWSRIGFEPSAMLYSTHQSLAESLNGAVALVPLDDAVDRLRTVKDAREQQALAAVIKLTDEVFVEATAHLELGVTERALAWRIEYLMRERGADALAFPTIVAAGPHAARPHHAPTDRPIEGGEPVIIDMGARLDGYNGDLTRTIWIGEPDPKLVDVYVVVERAQREALATIRPGVSGRDVDAVARSIIHRAGYGDFIVHGLGHGLGVRVHEGPSAGENSDDVLQAGEVLTVEPGIYIPNWGGVRLEDVGIVRDNGFNVLTAAPKRHLETML